MKKFLVFVLSISFFLTMLFSNNYKNLKTVSAQGQSAEIVMELNSGRVLHQSNAYEKKYMASTTKILTAIVIIENCNLDEVVTVGRKTVGVEGSSIYLVEGEKLSVKDLLWERLCRDLGGAL